MKAILTTVMAGYGSLSMAADSAQDSAYIQPSELELRIQCQQKISELRWHYNHWPEQNSNTKPSSHPSSSPQKIEQKVIDNLKKEAWLQHSHNWYLSEDMLNIELARIKQNTQSPIKLKHFLSALNHDQQLIKECLIRPALINQYHSIKDTNNDWRNADWSSVLRANLHQSATQTAPTIPAPLGRYKVVWTGNHMIIWGGSRITELGLGSGQSTAYLYDPMLDQWQSSSSFGTVEGRFNHTAVWTGTEMIVWGGETGMINSILGSGGSFDPDSLTWEALGDQNDLARHSHTAVWTGDEMIIWGGEMQNLTTKGSAYDPTTDMWQNLNIQNEPEARYDHAVIWSGTTMMIWGGINSDGQSLSGGIYIPQTQTWLTMNNTNEPSRRRDMHMTWTGSRLLVWGGRNNSTVYDSGYVYTPQTDSWSTMSVSNAPAPRYQAAHAWTGTQWFIWGGLDGTASPPNDGRLYSFNSDTWTTINQNNAPRQGRYHGAVWTGEKVLVWVGSNSSGKAYDIQTQTWTPMYGNDIFNSQFE